VKKAVPAANPDAYVAALTGWRRTRVQELRAAIRSAARLDEVIKWGNVVYLGNGDLSSTTPEGKTTVNSYAFGQTKFNPRDRTHSELLVKGSQRVIAVELK